jgi:hypothetical protein
VKVIFEMGELTEQSRVVSETISTDLLNVEYWLEYEKNGITSVLAKGSLERCQGELLEWSSCKPFTRSRCEWRIVRVERHLVESKVGDFAISNAESDVCNEWGCCVGVVLGEHRGRIGD